MWLPMDRAFQAKFSLLFPPYLPNGTSHRGTVRTPAQVHAHACILVLTFPQFHGHPVKPLPSSPRNRPGSNSRGSSDDASACRTPRCIRRCLCRFVPGRVVPMIHELARGGCTGLHPAAMCTTSCLASVQPYPRSSAVDTPLVGWQSEGQRFMMGVQEHKERVVQPASANREFIRV